VIPRMRTGVRVSDANQKQQPVKTIATTACKNTDRSARQHFVAQDLAIPLQHHQAVLYTTARASAKWFYQIALQLLVTREV
jgi:hypothetical protein